MAYTHIGYRPQVGYAHRGGKLWGHALKQPGVKHALNGGPDRYISLCRVVVHAEICDDMGFEYENGPRNIGPKDDAKITCKRCLQMIKQGKMG